MTTTTRRVDITPDPSLLPKSGQVNYTIPDAVGELMDNAVDERVAGELTTIDVYLGQKEGGMIRIADDGRGMSAETLANAMRMGHSAKTGVAIGRFGLGLKTACTNLGRNFEILSTLSEESVAHRVLYNEDAFLKANAWEIDVEEVEKPFPHGTVITITDPKVSIYAGVDDPVSVYAGRVFRHFLRNDQVQIIVNGVPVAPFEWDLLEDEGKHEFEWDINGKRVYGWIGYQKTVSRKRGYGFALIRHSRVLKTHEKIGFGEHSKYNRIVGEVFLDDFEVVNNKTDFVRDTDDWRKFVERMEQEVRPIALQASRKYSGKAAAEDKARIGPIEQKFEAAVKSEEFARALDRQLLADAIRTELRPRQVEKREPSGATADEDTASGSEEVVNLQEAVERRKRTPKETREVLRRTRTKLLDLIIEHMPVRFGPQSLYKTWDEEGLGNARRLVVSSNLDHPMFSHVNDTVTWVKHNIAESVAEYLSREAGVEDMLKVKSDILRFVGELEVAEEEQEEGIRAL